MASLNVSLPKTLGEYVRDQVDEGAYSTPSEYLRSLIREDQKRKVAERIEALLDTWTLLSASVRPPTKRFGYC